MAPSVSYSITVRLEVASPGRAVSDIGPYAALPVMEGKAALFKRFADIGAWPICLDSQDTDEIVRTVAVAVKDAVLSDTGTTELDR